MPLPAPIQRLNSFTAFQQGQGDNSFPGTALDADLDQTNNALDALITAVRAILRADGVLANGSVPRSALAADIMLGLGASRPWSSTVTYGVNDTVTRGTSLYVALKASTGADPATDTVSWVLQADLSQAVVVADGSITTSKLPDRAVTEPKLADGAVSNRALGSQTVTRDKAATNLGVIPVGGEIDFAGIQPPAGWQFCNGQSLDRVTYADLFNVLTITFTGTTQIGATIVSGLPDALANAGLFGAQIEGPGIPAGTIVTSLSNGGQLELNQAATANGTNVTLRLMPWGAANTTTFGIPDRRDRVTVGRGDMGGTSAGRITGLTNQSPLRSTQLGSYGGAEKITLTNGNLPVSLPRGSFTLPSLAPNIQTYTDLASIQAGTGLTFQQVWRGLQTVQQFTYGGQTITVTPSNPGGGQSFTVLPPVGVANRIIFAGV